MQTHWRLDQTSTFCQQPPPSIIQRHTRLTPENVTYTEQFHGACIGAIIHLASVCQWQEQDWCHEAPTHEEGCGGWEGEGDDVRRWNEIREVLCGTHLRTSLDLIISEDGQKFWFLLDLLPRKNKMTFRIERSDLTVVKMTQSTFNMHRTYHKDNSSRPSTRLALAQIFPPACSLLPLSGDSLR